MVVFPLGRWCPPQETSQPPSLFYGEGFQLHILVVWGGMIRNDKNIFKQMNEKYLTCQGLTLENFKYVDLSNFVVVIGLLFNQSGRSNLVTAAQKTLVKHDTMAPDLGGSAKRSWAWFNIKIPSYQYRKSHCGNKTVIRSSYLHNGISYTGKMTSLYWIRS